MAPAVAAAISERQNADELQRYLEFHQAGDWGLVSRSVSIANDRACEDCNDIFSLYVFGDNPFWIVTDDLHRFTALLLATSDC